MQGRYTHTHYCSYARKTTDAPANSHLQYIQAWIKMPQDPLLWVSARACRPDDQQKFVFINGASNTTSNPALLNVLFSSVSLLSLSKYTTSNVLFFIFPLLILYEETVSHFCSLIRLRDYLTDFLKGPENVLN